jgi:hypothetical protein
MASELTAAQEREEQIRQLEEQIIAQEDVIIRARNDQAVFTEAALRRTLALLQRELAQAEQGMK